MAASGSRYAVKVKNPAAHAVTREAYMDVKRRERRFTPC